MSYQTEILLIHPKYSPTGSYKIKSLSTVLTFNILSPLLTAFWPHQTSISSSNTLALTSGPLHLFFHFYSVFTPDLYMAGFSFELVTEGGVIILELYISFIEQGK